MIVTGTDAVHLWLGRRILKPCFDDKLRSPFTVNDR